MGEGQKKRMIKEQKRKIEEQKKKYEKEFYSSVGRDPNYIRFLHYDCILPIYNTLTPEEKKFYNFFMNKKPGTTIARRMEFAYELLLLIQNMRKYTALEREFFNKFFSDYKSKYKDPQMLLNFALRLQYFIMGSRAKGERLNLEEFSEEETTEPADYGFE